MGLLAREALFVLREYEMIVENIIENNLEMILKQFTFVEIKINN
jgi:hypothetical protein